MIMSVIKKILQNLILYNHYNLLNIGGYTISRNIHLLPMGLTTASEDIVYKFNGQWL